MANLQERGLYATSRRVGWKWRGTPSLAPHTLLPQDVHRRGYLHRCLDYPHIRHGLQDHLHRWLYYLLFLNGLQDHCCKTQLRH